MTEHPESPQMSLGDRMKMYEECYERRVSTNIAPGIIRVDGKAFKNFTSNCEKPFDKDFSDAMILMAKHLLNEIQSAKLAYVFSDEISILLDRSSINSEVFFDGKVNKIISVSAAMATAYFNSIYTRPSGFLLKKEDSKKDLALFDSRFFLIPKPEVVNYFIWRQSDCKRNSIQQYARSVYGPAKIKGISNNELLQRLSDDELSWENSVDDVHKFGTLVNYSSEEILTNPQFLQNRSCITDILYQ